MRWKRSALLVLRVGVTAAIAVAICITTVQRWSEVHQTIARLAWPSLIGSLLVAVLGMIAGMMAWRAALTDLGHGLPVGTAGRISLVGQLGKYLPGSVWAYVLQMELGRRAGVPRARVLIASAVSVGLAVTAGLVMGALGMPALLAAARGPGGTTGRTAVYLLIVAVPCALVCAHPRVLTWLVGRALHLLRRPPLAGPLTWHGVIATLGWSALAYGLFGVHLWLLAAAAGRPGAGTLVRSVGAMALAMTISVFAVIAPSGLGVREFVLVTALTPYVGSAGVALGVALSSRLIFTAADLLAAGGAAVSGTRRLHRHEPGSPAVILMPAGAHRPARRVSLDGSDGSGEPDARRPGDGIAAPADTGSAPMAAPDRILRP